MVRSTWCLQCSIPGTTVYAVQVQQIHFSVSTLWKVFLSLWSVVSAGNSRLGEMWFLNQNSFKPHFITSRISQNAEHMHITWLTRSWWSSFIPFVAVNYMEVKRMFLFFPCFVFGKHEIKPEDDMMKIYEFSQLRGVQWVSFSFQKIMVGWIEFTYILLENFAECFWLDVFRKFLFHVNTGNGVKWHPSFKLQTQTKDKVLCCISLISLLYNHQASDR